MAAGFYGEIVIRFVADTAPLSRGLTSAATQTEAAGQTIANSAKKTGAHWERAGLAMQNFGRTMTQFVSLPVAAGFAVATVAGYRYEKTLLKLKNLTGLTAAQTVKYGEAMKELGPKVGVGPQALAEAMYFVSSSGFKAKEALDVVTVAAKASASGMGDTQVITDALTSAINSYGHENLSAARAVDIMMKTIQVGKAEPEALATSLGRIMPVAAQLGVEFNQLGGMIAGLTLGGLSSAEAVTALRGAMFALVAPGKQAKKEMGEYGLSVRQIKNIVRNEGLLEALQLMYEKTNGNELALKRMIPNVRALNGVLSMLGPNYQNTRRTIDEVTKSQGKLNEAFAATSKTDVFKMDQAIAKIKAAFTDIGQKLLPIVADILEDVVGIVKRFSELSPATQAWIGKLLILGAALGPISMFMGSMVRSAALLNTALSSGRLAGFLAGAGGFTGAGGMGAALAGALSVGLAAAVAGVVATEVTAGIDAGLKQAKANAQQKKGFFEDFWSTFLAVPKGMADKANQVSGWLDEALGGAGAQRKIDASVRAQEALAQRISTAWGMALVRLKYIQADLSRATALPAVDAALKFNGPKTQAELVKLRSIIVRELDITKREANQILKLLFPSDWGRTMQKGASDAEHSLTNLRGQIQKLRAEMQKRLAFGDLKGADKIQRQIDDLLKHYDAAKGKAQKALKDLGDATKYVSEGINKHSGGVKGATNRLIDFIQLPMGKMGPKFRKQMEAAMKEMGNGADKQTDVSKKVAKAIRDAIAKGQITAKEATKIGAALSSGAADGIVAAVMAGKMRTAVRLAIKAGMDEAKAKSPSRETMKLGMWLSEGLAIGIKKKQGEAIAAAAEVAGNIVSTLDAALQIGADIKGFGEQGLPSERIATKWAKRAGALVRAIYAAIQKELKGLDLLDKESKNKKGDTTTIPGRGTKFSAIATLAGDIGSIFSAFSDMTTESATKSVEVLSFVRSKAALIGRNIVAMARSMVDAMKGLLITEFTGSNVTRAIQVANDLAGAITTFADLTYEKIKNAAEQIHNAMMWARPIAFDIREIALVIKEMFAGDKVDEIVAGAAGEAMSLASDLAGVITTFSELTKEKIDLAIAGMKELLFGGQGVVNVARFASYLRQIGDHIKAAFTNAKEDPVMAGAAKEAMDLATGIADIILKFAEITEKTIVAAKAGADRVIGYAPELGLKLVELVNAIAGSFKVISDNKDFEPASKIASGVSSFVGDVAGIISSLAGTMTGGEDIENAEGVVTGTKPLVSLVDKAKEGAKAVTAGVVGPEGLGKALIDMVGALTTSLGVLNVTDLTKLADALTKLNEIAGAISNIVTELADMTSTKVDTARNSGLALGAGFYNGLLEQYNKIMDLARRIPTDAAALIANPSLVLAPITKLASGGIVTRPTLALVGERGPEAVVPLDRAGGMGDTYKVNVYVDKLLARNENEGRQSVNALSSAVIHKLATARRATGRSLA